MYPGEVHDDWQETDSPQKNNGHYRKDAGPPQPLHNDRFDSELFILFYI